MVTFLSNLYKKILSGMLRLFFFTFFYKILFKKEVKTKYQFIKKN